MSKKDLSYLLPEKPEFYLSQMKKTYKLRIPNLQDQVWIGDKYKSQQGLQDVFAKKDWAEISKILFYFLEDKSDFLATDATIVDEMGEEHKMRLSGPQRLTMAIIGEETYHAIGAMTKAIVLANPSIEGPVLEELKKNATESLTQQNVKPIGAKSSTSSKRNTDGRKKK
jgi:hypothetical protein